ncbi:MAG: hypothetical protein ACI8PT_003240 [Gammaproteobacteria bacterium]|jgi:hypothetical protein
MFYLKHARAAMASALRLFGASVDAAPFHPDPSGVFDFDGPPILMTNDEIVGWATNVHEYSPGASVSGNFNDAN